MKIPAGSLSSGKSALSDTSFVASAENFRAQVELYKQLASSSKLEVPQDDRDEHKKDLQFLEDELSLILKKELDDFSNEKFKEPDQYFYQRVASLSTYMYLLDKLLELGNAVDSKKTVGIYSLYDELATRLFALMSTRFFLRPLNEALRDYLEIEPLLVACAELTDVDLEPIQGVVELYRAKLTEKVGALLESGEKKLKGKAKQKPAKKSARGKAAKKSKKKSRKK
jgi:hypothetical protein